MANLPIDWGVRAATLLAGMLLLAAGCPKPNTFVPPPPPKVTVAQPVKQDVAETIEFTGTTRPSDRVEIRARVNGYLQEVKFKDGADVKEGDLLFVIDQAPFKAARDVTIASVEKAKSERDLASANLARSEELAKQNAIPLQEVDIDRAEEATSAANVKAAEAELVNADLNLSYTEIRAPISGRIGSHLVDAGNLIRSEETLLAVIEKVDPIYAYFYVGERDLFAVYADAAGTKIARPQRSAACSGYAIGE